MLVSPGNPFGDQDGSETTNEAIGNPFGDTSEETEAGDVENAASRRMPQSTAAVMKDDAQDSASRGSIDAPHQLAALVRRVGQALVLEIESTLGFLRPLLEL